MCTFCKSICLHVWKQERVNVVPKLEQVWKQQNFILAHGQVNVLVQIKKITCSEEQLMQKELSLALTMLKQYLS